MYGRKSSLEQRQSKIRSKPVGFLCGCGLGEGQALYLACRVWDEADTPSAWSAPSDFSILTSEAAFAGSEWIGAITRKDARIPEGRKYHGSELKKPEAKAAWVLWILWQRKVFICAASSMWQKK